MALGKSLSLWWAQVLGQQGLSFGVCCREALCTAGVHVHLRGKPVEPTRHPFHVSHGAGTGELTGEVPGTGCGGNQDTIPKEILRSQDCQGGLGKSVPCLENYPNAAEAPGWVGGEESAVFRRAKTQVLGDRTCRAWDFLKVLKRSSRTVNEAPSIQAVHKGIHSTQRHPLRTCALP